MPVPPIFTTTNFNPGSLPTHSVILNAAGIIDPGPISNPAQLGYTTANIDAQLEADAAAFGLGTFFYDIDAQAPNATYFIGISSATTQNGQTTYLVDNGIRGTQGNDVILDPQGDNIINARGGDDIVVTGGGADAIKAGRGNDTVYSGAGDDVVLAGGGDDIVIAFDGNDAVRGQGGHDLIFGGFGDDTLLGDGGHDTLIGGTGADMIEGGGGRDEINGGMDDDILTGGRGRDDFIFDLDSGTDRITDFETNRDDIVIETAYGLSSWQDVQGQLSQNGADVWLTLSATDLVIVENTQLADLGAGNFDFI